jgi:hypothetical protein
MVFVIQFLSFLLPRFRSASHINVNNLLYSAIHWCSNSSTMVMQLAAQLQDFPSFTDIVAYLVRILSIP